MHLNYQLATGIRVEQSSNLISDTSFLLRSPGLRRVTIERASQPLARMRITRIGPTVDLHALWKALMTIRMAHSIDVKNWSDWSTSGAQHAGASALVLSTDTKLLNPNVALSAYNGSTEYKGDGTTKTFYLVKTYSIGSLIRHKRIYRPIAASFVTSLSSPTLDATIGKVTVSVAPSNGTNVTWGGTFYTPAALITNDLTEATLTGYDVEEMPIEFEEVILEETT